MGAADREAAGVVGRWVWGGMAGPSIYHSVYATEIILQATRAGIGLRADVGSGGGRILGLLPETPRRGDGRVAPLQTTPTNIRLVVYLRLAAREGQGARSIAEQSQHRAPTSS